MPGGNAVAPPELAGDAPVVDVGHPLHVGLAVHVGGELDVAFGDGARWRSGDGVAFDSLTLALRGWGTRAVAAGRLLTARNHCSERRGSMTAPVRCERAMASGVILDGDQQAGGFEVGDDLFAGVEAIETMVGRARRERCARSRP